MSKSKNKTYNIIYKTTNLINGKIYIGVHCTTDLNDDYIGSGKILWRSIRKYGRENFKKEILMLFDSKNEAFFHEKLIVTLEFIKRKDTYNKKLGGRGGWEKNDCSLKGFINRHGKIKGPIKYSNYCDKIRKANKGRIPSIKGMTYEKFYGEEKSKKISERLKISGKGKIPWNKGLKTGPAWNSGIKTGPNPKISAANKNKPKPPRTKEHSKKLGIANKEKCIVKDAITNIQIGKVNINHPKILSGEWIHINKGRPSKLKGLPSKRMGVPSGKGKKVLCIELNKVFNSCLEAMNFIGLKNPYDIHDVALGKGKTAGGYHWRYPN